MNKPKDTESAQRLTASLAVAQSNGCPTANSPSGAQRLTASLAVARLGIWEKSVAKWIECSTPDGVIGCGATRKQTQTPCEKCAQRLTASLAVARRKTDSDEEVVEMCSTPDGVIGCGAWSEDRAAEPGVVLNA